MTKVKRKVRSTAIAISLCLTAVSVAWTQPDAVTGESTDVLEDPAFSGTFDEVMYQIAQVHPHFAGFWLDESAGTTTVLFKGQVDQTTSEEVARLLAVASDDQRFLERRVVPRGDADYSFKELFEWYQPLRGASGSIPGRVLSDIDERANRIKFGVLDLTAKVEREVEEILRRHGVPRDAVIIEEWGPIAQMPGA